MIWLRIGGDIDVQVWLAQVIQDCNWNIGANKMGLNMRKIYMMEYIEYRQNLELGAIWAIISGVIDVQKWIY